MDKRSILDTLFLVVMFIGIWGYSLGFCSLIAHMVLEENTQVGYGIKVVIFVSTTLMTVGIVKGIKKLVDKRYE